MRNISKWLVFIAFVAVYVPLIPLGFDVVDPCASNPPLNYVRGFIVLDIFPILASLLFYYLFYKTDKFSWRIYAKSFFMFLGVMFCSFLVLGLELAYMYDLLLWATWETSAFSWFFNFGCHEGIELRHYMTSVFYVLNISFFCWLFYRLCKKVC